MTEIIKSISRGIRPEVARRRIEAFRKRFKEAHFYFAQHAAFPLALTPDLLYRLHENFQRTSNDKQLTIPWIAVADLLLSPLCEEVDSGYELYEMDVTIRAQLLEELQANPDFGAARIQELAAFLQSYAQEQLTSSDPTLVEVAQSQKWTALAYTQPGQAAQELAATVKILYNNDSLEQVRIASLLETLGTLAEPLAQLEGFQPLLTYTQEQAHSILGHTQIEDAPERIKQATTQVARSLGVNLPTNREEQASKGPDDSRQQATEISDFYISHHNADHDRAQQIAQQLQEAGYSIVWGFVFGITSRTDIDTSFVRNQARHTIALLSPDYLSVDNVQKEWTAILAESQQQEQRLLLPIRVRECTPQGIFASIQYLDLVGQDEETARERVLQFVYQSPNNSTIPAATPDPGIATPIKPLKLFYSYAHKDEAFLDKLMVYLQPLQQQGLIDPWNDRNISGGISREQEINQQLNTAQIVVLLVSDSFIATNYTYEIEMKQALDRQEAGKARVVPVLIKPLLQGNNPFLVRPSLREDVDLLEEPLLDDRPFAKLQVLPSNGRPISSWANQDEAFKDIVQSLRKIIEEFGASEPLVRDDDESKIQELKSRARANHDAGAYIELGRLYERLRRVEEAIQAYQAAWSIHIPRVTQSDITTKEDIDILFALSRLCNDIGSYEQAIAYLHQLIALQPDFADAYKQRGLVYRREADAEFAVTGDAELRSVKYNLAIADLERAIELRPDFEEALGSLGGLYRRVGNYERAAGYYKRLYDVNNGSSYALGNLASLSWYLGRREEALNYFTSLEEASQRRLKEGKDEAYWDYYDLALSQLARGKIDVAQGTYAQAIEETPTIVQLDAVLSNLYFLQKAPEPIKGLEEIIAMIENAKDMREAAGS